MIYKIIITCGFFIAVYARDTFIHSRIIGGTEANKGEFPHLVSIQLLNSQHNCGGSILNEKWILTAAHCILKDNMLIKAGKHNVKIIEENEQSSLVDKIFVHKNYIPPGDGSVAPFDLALLKLKTPFKITRNVIPIQLCKKDMLPKSNATIAGWGKVSDPNGLFPDTLQKVTLPIIDLKTCNDSILAVNEKLSALHKTNICTGPLIGGHGACFGDSGSSLISYENGNPELIGVFSWITLPCAAPGRVSVYVRVSAFIDWIQAIISKN